MYDLVYDMTGFDMTTTTKDDLHKEMVDEAVSVAAITPEPSQVSYTHNLHLYCVYVCVYVCVCTWKIFPMSNSTIFNLGCQVYLFGKLLTQACSKCVLARR